MRIEKLQTVGELKFLGHIKKKKICGNLTFNTKQRT